jgi:enoyl-CoA hydratase
MPDVVMAQQASPGVLLIRLNRPDALNSLNAELVDGLLAILRDVKRDPSVRAIVLTGNGRAFCAGLDLRGYGTPPHGGDGEGRSQGAMRVQEHLADLATAFRGARAPIIAAINGAAAGGGMSLALLCDLRVMSANAALHASFIHRGLAACDMGVSWLLPRIVGLAQAADILLTGRTVDADEAVSLGLVVSSHATDEVLAAALDKARLIAELNPFGVWLTKQVLWSNLEGGSFQAGVDLENRTQILSSLTHDHREAVTAFLEKRPAAFQNR